MPCPLVGGLACSANSCGNGYVAGGGGVSLSKLHATLQYFEGVSIKCSFIAFRLTQGAEHGSV